MKIGIVENWDKEVNAGTISCDGVLFDFEDRDGQSVATYTGDTEPQLSGGSVSTPPFSHKVPRVGDPVIFQTLASKVTAWGYARHYVDAAERRYGTQFRPVDSIAVS